MFGAVGNPDHDDSIRIIHKALDAGINFVDTADVYSHGESEEIVGKALKGRRDDVVLATKARPVTPTGDGLPTSRAPRAAGSIRAVEDSLRRLQTDYIDLYQIHRPDPDTDIEETLSALTDLVRAGKVRAIGSSTLPASDIVEAHWVAERRGLTASAPSSRRTRSSTAASSARSSRWSSSYGMGTLVWSPLPAACSPAATARTSRTTHAPVPVRLPAPDRRAQPRRRRAAHPARRGRRAAADPPGHGVRHRPPRRHLGDHRAAHHGTARRPPRRRSTSPSPTRSSTGSTRSSRPAPTSADSTWPTTHPPSSTPTYAAAPPPTAPPPNPARRPRHAARPGRRSAGHPLGRARRSAGRRQPDAAQPGRCSVA